MNRKEIITADLCGRLPYGLRCEVTDNNLKKTATLSAVYSDGTCCFYDTIESEKGFQEIKPILFPSLTEPITVAGYNDGLPFAPIDKVISDTNCTINPKTILMLIESGEWYVLPCYIIDLLNQWHCNYRLLPNEFVPATNEYA